MIIGFFLSQSNPILFTDLSLIFKKVIFNSRQVQPVSSQSPQQGNLAGFSSTADKRNYLKLCTPAIHYNYDPSTIQKYLAN